MEKVVKFKHEKIGVIRCIFRGNNILFCGKDVAGKLGYSDAKDAVKKHCRQRVLIDVPHPQNEEKTSKMIYITEGDMNTLITKSDLKNENVLSFQEWVNYEVIPSIRKNGGYVKEDREEEFIKNMFPSFSPDIQKEMALDLYRQNKKNKEELDKMKPKAEIAERMIISNREYTFEQVAKLFATKPDECEYGLGLENISRITLPRKLRELGILSKAKKGKAYKNTPNKPYEKYFNVVDIDMEHFTQGHIQTKVKSEGLEYLYKIFKNMSDNV